MNEYFDSYLFGESTFATTCASYDLREQKASEESFQN